MAGQRGPQARFRWSVVLSTQPASFSAVAFKGDLEANIARIAGWGYDGVELAVRDPRLLDVEELVWLVEAHGLTVPAIGTGQAWGEEHLSFTDPDPAVRVAAVARTVSHAPLAERFGALIIIGLLRGVVAHGVTPEQAMDWLVEALRTCCAAAEATGVRLALEPINRYETGLINTVDEGLALLDRVRADNLGLLLDTFHMNIEESSPEESILKAGQHIFHFHVADSNRWYPGAGHVDFARTLDALGRAGYTGYVSGEFMPLPDGETAARKAIAYLRSL